MIARAVYTVLLHLALPLLALRLVLRARRQPAYLQHLGERFGRYRQPVVGPVIWVHAVSVGETRAAEPLVRRLLEIYPTHQIVLTHMTVTGRATSAQLFGPDQPRLLRVYLPYDLPWAVAGFVSHFRPQWGLIMETELWPNLFQACKKQGVSLMLANARLSEKSARGYRRIAPLTRAALGCLDLVAAQTAEDAQRLRALGAGRVEVVGNLKFDITPPADQLALGAALRASMGARPVLLAASTREGEEEAILRALDLAPAEVLLVLVPRHPQRFNEVAQLAARLGLRVQRRSEQASVAAETRVWLGDSMGEMFAYYSCADLAFVGGSLAPLGGQNLIEACAVGVPVLVGMHTFNFTAVTEQAIAAGAARRVADAPALMREAKHLFDDAPTRAAMAQAGRAFALAHRGATERVLAALARETARHAATD